MRPIAILLSVMIAMTSAFQCNRTEKKDDCTIVLHPHESLPENTDGMTTIFLAGTIDMGNSTDWQAETAEYFSNQPGRYLLFNPRQEHWDANREGVMDYQVNWELEHLEKADIIIMNFLADSRSPITLLEMGLFARSGKLLVCCPKKFYRYDNVRITCKRYDIPLYEDFPALLEAVGKQ